MSKLTYKHTRDMGEISGFGGAYEATCQQMLNNGVKWLEAHKSADIKVLENPRIYGIVQLGSAETEELDKAVMTGIDDATGAMHHTVMSRLAFIAKNGWDAYCSELREAQTEGAVS